MNRRPSPRRRNPRNPQTETPAFKQWFGKSVTTDRNGDPVVFYHGSDEPNIEEFGVQRTSYGYFFTPDVDTAAYYGDTVYEVYLKIENLADLDEPVVFDEIAREAVAYTEQRDREAVQKFAARLYHEGYGKHPAVTAFFDAQRDFEYVLNEGWDVEEMLSDNDVENTDVDALVARINQPNVTKAYNDAAPVESKELREAEEAYGGQDFYMNYQDDFLHAAQNLGYDGVVLTDPSPTGEAISYVVFSPKQIKSATGNAGTFDPDDPSILRNPRRNPRPTTADRTDPALWEAVKREVTAGSKGGKPGQWSARKAQLAVALYRQRGGGYWGPKDPRNSLAKWTREKWRTKSGRPSLETGERYLPTKAIAALTDAEYAATTRAKRAGMRKGQQFVPQPEAVALKVRSYRRNSRQQGQGIDPRLLAADGARYFSDEALAEADQEAGSSKSRTALVLMRPRDFLKMAEPGMREDSQAALERVLDAGVRLSDVPRLFIATSRTDPHRAVVTGHEGRHRSRALLARGVTQMPVRIHSQDIRWGEQTDPESWDYDPVLPSVLVGEGANKHNTLPMPVPLHYPELAPRLRPRTNPRRKK
jgi:hypothetical protein